MFRYILYEFYDKECILLDYCAVYFVFTMDVFMHIQEKIDTKHRKDSVTTISPRLSRY